MKEIKSKHYVETILYSIDMVLRMAKSELKQKIDALDFGITSEQFVVLDTISCHTDIYPQKLSDILMKDKSNTTRIIKVLTKKGLITKKIGKVNNRLVYKLNITEKGKQLVDENMPIIKKCLSEIFVDISDEEIDLLRSLSGKFQKDLSQISHNNTN